MLFDLRCYHHPEREATGQCDSCGDYLCSECICMLEGQQLCDGCWAGAHPTERAIKRLRTCSSNFYILALLTLLFPGGMHPMLYFAPMHWEGLISGLLGFSMALCLALTGWLLAHKRGYILCVVLLIIACCSFPFGTCLAGFALFVLHSPEVRSLFGNRKNGQINGVSSKPSLRTEVKCRNHADRSACEVCYRCGGEFCSECITESARRKLCGNCHAHVRLQELKTTLTRLSYYHSVLAAIFALVGSLALLSLWDTLPSVSLASATSVGAIVPLLFAAIAGLLLAASVFLFFAGRFIRRRTHYRFCVFAAGLSCIFVPLGTVLGIYALIVLSRSTVKDYFVERGVSPAR